MPEPLPLFAGVRELKAAIQAVLDSLDDTTNHKLCAARDELHWGMSGTGFSGAASQFIFGLPIRDDAKLTLEELFAFNFKEAYREEPIKGVTLLKNCIAGLNRKPPKPVGRPMKKSTLKLLAEYDRLKKAHGDLSETRLYQLTQENTKSKLPIDSIRKVVSRRNKSKSTDRT